MNDNDEIRAIHERKVKKLSELKEQFFFLKNLQFLYIKEGWFNLVHELCLDISKFNLPESFEVRQIKEKFGGLRFYYYPFVDGVEKLVSIAESKSFKICEVCGESGNRLISDKRFFQTRCEEHLIKGE